MTKITQIILISFTVLLFGVCVKSAFSAETKKLTAGWEYQVADQVKITGFKFYDQDNKVVLDNVPVASRTASFQASFEPGKCNSYYMTAVTVDGESKNSNIFPVCLKPGDITLPASVTIKFAD